MVSILAWKGEVNRSRHSKIKPYTTGGLLWVTRGTLGIMAVRPKTVLGYVRFAGDSQKWYHGAVKLAGRNLSTVHDLRNCFVGLKVSLVDLNVPYIYNLCRTVA